MSSFDPQTRMLTENFEMWVELHLIPLMHLLWGFAPENEKWECWRRLDMVNFGRKL